MIDQPAAVPVYPATGIGLTDCACVEAYQAASTPGSGDCTGSVRLFDGRLFGIPSDQATNSLAVVHFGAVDPTGGERSQNQGYAVVIADQAPDVFRNGIRARQGGDIPACPGFDDAVA